MAARTCLHPWHSDAEAVRGFLSYLIFGQYMGLLKTRSLRIYGFRAFKCRSRLRARRFSVRLVVAEPDQLETARHGMTQSSDSCGSTSSKRLSSCAPMGLRSRGSPSLKPQVVLPFVLAAEC